MQQPSALTARKLLECNQPCTDRKCHVALKQRKALNVAVKPTRIEQSIRQSLRTLQQFHAAICLRQDPLEAILVIFGRRALIFFV